MNNSPAIQAQGRDLFTLRKLLDRICTHVHKKRNELKIYEENDNELNFFKRTKSVPNEKFNKDSIRYANGLECYLLSQ